MEISTDWRIITEFFHFLVEIRASLKRGIGGLAVTEEDTVDDRLAVDGVAQGVWQFTVVFKKVIVEVVEDTPVICSVHIVDGKAVHCSELFGILRGNLGKIEFAGLELKSSGLLVGDDFKDNFADFGFPGKIVRVLL